MQQYFAIDGQIVYPTNATYSEDHVSYFEKSDEELPLTHGAHKYDYDISSNRVLQDGIELNVESIGYPCVRIWNEYLCIIQDGKIYFVNLNGDIVHTLENNYGTAGYKVHMDFMYFFDENTLYKVSKDFEISEVHEFEDSITSIGSLGETLGVLTDNQVYIVDVSDNSVEFVTDIEYIDEHAYFNGRLYINSYVIDSEGNVDYTYTFTSAIETGTYLMLGDEACYKIYDADMNCLYNGTGDTLGVEVKIAE